MLREIDLTKKVQKPTLSIHKPNGTKIGNLPEAYKISYQNLLSRINELSFDVPYLVERNHKIELNKNINKLKERYLIKIVWGYQHEWFIITNAVDTMDGSKDIKSISARSLAYELHDKLIRNYEVISYTPLEVLNDALKESIWAVGEISPIFADKKRSFDVSEKSTLDFVTEIAETFKAIIEWDTENRLIHLRAKDEIGINRGFKISYGKYLRNIKKSSNSEAMITHLKVYGRDGLSINRVNPTGSDAIESYSWFMYPFQRDLNKNVIKSSDYMSDSLCHAILDYEELVDSKKGQFSSLLDQKTPIEESLFKLKNNLFDLQTELLMIEDQLDIAKATNSDTTQLEVDKQNKENEISSKQTEIDTVQIQLDSIDTSIVNLKNELAIENNFTPEQIIERNKFSIQRTWADDSYIDDQELFDEAVRRFQEMKSPETTFDIDIVNFKEILEEQRNWDKLHIGDTISIVYENFDTNIKALVTEIHYNDGNLSLVITNVEDMNKKDKIIEMLYKSYSTSTTVDMSRFKWDETKREVSDFGEALSNMRDAAKNRITAGVNETVEISRRGIIIKNPSFPNEIIVMQAGVLALSENAGNTWSTAITPKHIVAEVVMGKLLAGENLIIESTSGKFTFDENGATIEGASFQLKGGQNGLSIDPDTGLMVVKSDGTIRTSLNATDGIKIQRLVNAEEDEWQDVFFIDVDGNLTLRGNIIMTGGSISWDTVTPPSYDKIPNAKPQTHIDEDGIYTGSITFDQAFGGTATLGGLENGNGRLVVYDENGQLIAELDAKTGGFNRLYVADLSSPTVPRYMDYSTSPLRYYVSTYNVYPGSSSSVPDDNNTGESFNSPLATIGEAIRRIPKHYDGNVEVTLAEGSNFYEYISLPPFIGAGNLTINGQSTNTIIYGLIDCTGGSVFYDLKNFTLQSRYDYAAISYNRASGKVSNIKVYGMGTNGTENGVLASHGASVEVTNCEIKNVKNCISSRHGASIHNFNNGGQGSLSGLQAYGGFVTGGGTYPSGATNQQTVEGGQIWVSGSTDTGGTTPPPPNPTISTVTYNAQAAESWDIPNGQWAGSYMGSDVIQGKWGSSGRFKGLWFFGNGLNMTGKTIKQIRLTSSRKNGAGNAQGVSIAFRPHAYSNRPTGEPSFLNAFYQTSFSWGETKTITLPSSFHSFFSNGSARGIGIYIEGDSAYYARFTNTAKLEFTYE